MSKVLYAQKMFLLKDLQVDEAKLQEDGVQIDGEFTDEYKQNLERFVKFCSHVYMPCSHETQWVAVVIRHRYTTTVLDGQRAPATACVNHLHIGGGVCIEAAALYGL